MKKFINGIVDFRKNLTPETKELFANLAQGQNPDALFIACSDSRIMPNIFASANPGDLFVLRNVGNLIPPASHPIQETCASAALEFSVFTLNVSDIIVCGHSECGAMHALLKDIEIPPGSEIESWLTNGKESITKFKQGLSFNPSLPDHDQLSQLNVIQQIHHIETYPFVYERIEKKQLRIHGLWFDIASADVYYYEKNANQFVLIDEAEALKILERLHQL